MREVALAAISEEGIACLLVTHDANEAFAVADRIAVMKDGCILQEDRPDRIYAAPASLSVATALGHIRTLDITDLPDLWRSGLTGDGKVHLRNEAIVHDAGSPVRLKVISARRQPGCALVELALPDGAVATAVSLSGTLPRMGEFLPVRFERSFAYTFNAAQT